MNHDTATRRKASDARSLFGLLFVIALSNAGLFYAFLTYAN